MSVPSLGDAELIYLKECLESNWVSSVGPFVDRFEARFAELVGARYAVACASGTAALHVAMRLLDVGPGDEVMVASFTFAGSVNPILYERGVPVLVDSEARTWNLNPNLVVPEIKRRVAAGRRLPKAVEVVHILGHPAEIDDIVEICDRYGIPVIEDAAEALGATYAAGRFKDRMAGSIGRIGCFSFNGNKVITCGGGGMLVTDEPELARRAKHLTTQARQPGLEYWHDEVGYNYRLTNLAAALGLAQLEQLPAFLARKREIAARYDAAFRDIPGIDPPPRNPSMNPSLWLYSVLIDHTAYGCTAREVLVRLRGEGVEARPVWTPLHMMNVYSTSPRLGGEVSEMLFNRGLSLPSSVSLTPEDQQRVIDVMRRCAHV